MQVSWIDPEEISKLAAQLDGPLQREETAPWDIDTLPDLSSLFAPEESGGADPSELADAIASPVPEALDQQGAAPAPEIEHIREKLRAIRSRAEDAGLLPTQKAPEPEHAEAVVALPRSPESTSADDNDPAAVATSRQPIRIPPAPHHAPAPATEPAADPLVSQSPAPSPYLPPGSPITERLQGFMSWAQSVAPCEDILLVDDHGDLLWGGPSRADLALSVVLAAGAGLRSSSEALTRSSVFIRSRLGEQKELSVLPCPTRYGMVTLALLNATGLPNDTVARLREALTLCIDGRVLPPGTGAEPTAA